MIRIIYFGTPEFSAAYLRALLDDSAFDVVALVTQQDELQGRKKVLTPPPTKQLFLERYPDRPVFQPQKLRDPEFIESLRALDADFFVVFAYGKIMPQSVLDIPKLGNVNVHPSLLPLWRGPTPMPAAIANGDTETGVTFMLMDAEMDHGPILNQITIPLASNETFPTLVEKVIAQGAPVLLQTLKDFHAGTITPREQEHDKATYCHLFTRDTGRIIWTEPAETIERKLRAYQPWPGLWTTFTMEDGSSTDVKVHALSISDKRLASGEILIEGKRLFVGAGSNAIELLEVQPATKNRMAVRNFLDNASPKVVT